MRNQSRRDFLKSASKLFVLFAAAPAMLFATKEAKGKIFETSQCFPGPEDFGYQRALVWHGIRNLEVNTVQELDPEFHAWMKYVAHTRISPYIKRWVPGKGYV